jgi:hypothetical protein
LQGNYLSPTTPRELLDKIRETNPWGHPKFSEIFLDHIKLHSEKNFDYARGGRPLGNFERVARILALYPEFPFNSPSGVATMFLLKQLDAVMWAMCRENATGMKENKESIKDRRKDITIYSGILECMDSDSSR